MDLRAEELAVGLAVETITLDEPARERLAARHAQALPRAIARTEARGRRAGMISATVEDHPAVACLELAGRDVVRQPEPCARAENRGHARGIEAQEEHAGLVFRRHVGPEIHL